MDRREPGPTRLPVALSNSTGGIGRQVASRQYDPHNQEEDLGSVMVDTSLLDASTESLFAMQNALENGREDR
eukprot:1438108-Lingulodinium_polyedra.AAC.1